MLFSNIKPLRTMKLRKLYLRIEGQVSDSCRIDYIADNPYLFTVGDSSTDIVPLLSKFLLLLLLLLLFQIAEK